MTCQHHKCRNRTPIDRRCHDGRHRQFCSNRCATLACKHRRYIQRCREGLCAYCGRPSGRDAVFCAACAGVRNSYRRATYWNGQPMSREQALQILGRTA